MRPGFAALLVAVLALGSASLAIPAAAPAYGPIIKYECEYQPAIGAWWAIPNCEAAVTPWITVGKGGHSGWKLYCPNDAPFLYQDVINAGVSFSTGGTDWSRSSKWIDAPTPFSGRYTGNGYADWLNYEGQTLNPADFTPGWLDAYVINWSVFGSHSWRYAIGCSAINAPQAPNTWQLPPPPDNGPDGSEALDYQNIVASAEPPDSDDEVAPIAPAPTTQPAQPVTPPAANPSTPVAPPSPTPSTPVTPSPTPVTPVTPSAPVATTARTRRSDVRYTHLKRRSLATMRPDQRIERLRELPLPPNRTTTVNVSCAAGEKLVHGNYAIAYDTPRPPSHTRHAATYTAGKRIYSVRVKVGKIAHNTVWLQARAICEKK